MHKYSIKGQTKIGDMIMFSGTESEIRIKVIAELKVNEAFLRAPTMGQTALEIEFQTKTI